MVLCTAAMVSASNTDAAPDGNGTSPRSNPDTGNASSYILKQLNTVTSENGWAYIYVTDSSLDEKIFWRCPLGDDGLLGRCVDFSMPVIDDKRVGYDDLNSIAFHDGGAYVSSSNSSSMISTCEVLGSGSLDFCVSADSGLANVVHVETYGEFLYIMDIDDGSHVYQCLIDETNKQAGDCIEVWAETIPGSHKSTVFKFY